MAKNKNLKLHPRRWHSPQKSDIIRTQIDKFSFTPNTLKICHLKICPSVLIDGSNQPDEITVNVGAKLGNENQYEVTLNLVAKASSGETALFLVDLTYAGVVTPEGVDTNEINSLVMIEAPRLLFPFYAPLSRMRHAMVDLCH